MEKIFQEAVETTKSEYFFLQQISSENFYDSSTKMTRIVFCCTFFYAIALFLFTAKGELFWVKALTGLALIPFTIVYFIIILFYANIFIFLREHLVRNYIILIVFGMFIYGCIFYFLRHIHPIAQIIMWLLSIYMFLELRLLILDSNVYSYDLKFMGNYLSFFLTLSLVPELLTLILLGIMICVDILHRFFSLLA